MGGSVRRVSGIRVCRIGRLRSSIRVHARNGGGNHRGGSDCPDRLVLHRPNVACGGRGAILGTDIPATDSLRPDARAGDVTRPGSTVTCVRSPTLSCGHRQHIGGSDHRRDGGPSRWRGPDPLRSRPPRSSPDQRSMRRDRREPRFRLEPNRSHPRWWNRVRPDRRPSAVDTDRTVLIRDWVGSDPLSPLIADSTSDISIPGRSALRWALIPSRVYWIDNHRTRHESTASSEVGGLARRAARSRAVFDNPRHSAITASSVSAVASFEIAST